MPLGYLLDENLRGPLWNAIQRHNRRGLEPVDVVRVGDPMAPPLETDDPGLLVWAEQEARILITLDRSTIPDHLHAHVSAGFHSPGIFIVRRGASIAAVLEYLVLAAYAGSLEDWRDQIQYVPSS